MESLGSNLLVAFCCQVIQLKQSLLQLQRNLPRLEKPSIEKSSLELYIAKKVGDPKSLPKLGRALYISYQWPITKEKSVLPKIQIAPALFITLIFVLCALSRFSTS